MAQQLSQVILTFYIKLLLNLKKSIKKKSKIVICCKNGIKLYFKSNNWEIKVPEDIDIEHLLKTFKLEEESKDEDNIIYSLKPIRVVI